ncbi:MAG: thioredoxin domain-containing protein [Sulfurospirillum sp.]
MMSLMLRLLSIILISSVFANASVTTEQKLIKFINKAINTGRGFKFKKAEVIYKEVVPSNKNWEAYFLKIDLQVPSKHKDISVKDIIFSNGKLISKDFIDINTGRSIKNSFSFPATPEMYDDEHLLTGSKNAKNKLILFSDPQCPFCMEYVPELLEWMKKHKKNFALYYYHLPLSIHPTSKALVKAELAAEKLGIMSNADLNLKVYTELFDFKDNSEASVLKEFNRIFKTHLTKKDINTKDILERLNGDIRVARNLMINSTPTLYVNGKKDPSRSLYKKLAKEGK